MNILETILVCRNLEEVHRYLRITGSNLEIDFFNYDWFLSGNKKITAALMNKLIFKS